LSGKLRDTLLADDALVYRFLRPERVRRLVEDHHAGRRNHHKVIFSLVVLEEWLRRTGAVLGLWWFLTDGEVLAPMVSAAV
jgi:asparagine synthase (glutamine-hydrolysing)